MPLMNPAQRSRGVLHIRSMAARLSESADDVVVSALAGDLHAVAQRLSQMPVLRWCDECLNFNRGHCMQWKADVPDAARLDGCDAWDEDIPF